MFDILPIRNLHIISQTLGTYNSVSVNGERGITFKKNSLLDQIIMNKYIINNISNAIIKLLVINYRQ